MKMTNDKRDKEMIMRLQRIFQGEMFEKKEIKLQDNYALTYDNFYKMCVLIYRIQSEIPVILMGESGVGKTRLVSELAHLCSAQFRPFHVHAGKKKK